MDLKTIRKATELLDKATPPRGHRLLFSEGRLYCECGASCELHETMNHAR